MSFDYRHWLALACLLPSLVLFAMSYDMPVFRDAGRIEALSLREPGADYRLKSERFNQAVKEALTPKLDMEACGACLLVLSLLTLQLPKDWRSRDVGRWRLLAYGFGTLLLFPVLAIDASMRDYWRGLYPAWADSIGMVWFGAVVLDLILLLVLAPFLYRASKGVQGAGMIYRGAAALLLLMCLAIGGAGLVSGGYVTLAAAGGLALFFGYFLLAATGTTRR